MIVLLFIENISKFLRPHRLSSKHLLVSQHSFRLRTDVFSLQILLKKQMKCIKQRFLSILALMLHSVLVSNWAILSLNSHELFCHFLKFHTHVKTARLPLLPGNN